MEELSTYELDLLQEVLAVGVAVLLLNKLFLVLNEIKPRSHVAELLEDIGIHLEILYALAVWPPADNPLLQGQLACAMEMTRAPLLGTLEILVYLLQNEHKRLYSVSLIVHTVSSCAKQLSQYSLLKRKDGVNRSFLRLFDTLEKSCKFVHDFMLGFVDIVCGKNNGLKYLLKACEMPQVLHHNIDEAIVCILVIHESVQHIGLEGSRFGCQWLLRHLW